MRLQEEKFGVLIKSATLGALDGLRGLTALAILGSQHSGVCLEFWHEYRQSCLLQICGNSLLTSHFGGTAAHLTVSAPWRSRRRRPSQTDRGSSVGVRANDAIE